jgi:hypothetical protein
MHLGDQADRFGTVLRIAGQEAPVGKGLGQVPGDGDAVGQQAAFGVLTTGTVPAPPKAATSAANSSE